MEVRIKVGASVDQSLRYAFRPLVQSAIEARRQILKEFGQVPKEITALFAAGGRGQSQAYRGVVAEARAAAREQQLLAKQTAAEETKQAKEAGREQAQASRQALAQMKRDHAAYDREQRAAARQQAQDVARSARELDRFATRTSHRATRFLAPTVPIASIAHRAASSMVTGFGIDTSYAGALQRNIELENRAGTLTNQARLSNQEVPSADIQTSVKAVAGKYGMKRADVMGALEQLQELTGDLPQAMGMLEKLGQRAIVTGTNIHDFAGMVGNSVNSMENVTDKAGAALRVADALAVQGARGAVEVKNMAKYQALLAPQANKFVGGSEHNMQTLGALAQLARESGGAGGPAEAVRSIARFATTFRTGARLKAFERVTGSSAFADKGKTILRDPVELIKAALVGTKGNQESFNKIFMNVIGAKPADALLSRYNGAGGGDAGLKAVDAALAKFTTGLQLSDDVIRKNLAENEGKRSTQAEKFQQQLDDVAEELSAHLLPVLKDVQPQFLAFVKGMGELAAWAVKNPGQAIVAAIVASIARAGIESALRAAIERAIGGVGGEGRAGKAAAALPLIGTALALGGAAVTERTIAGQASSDRIRLEGSTLNKFRTLSKTPGAVTAQEREQMYRDILDSEEDLKARKKRNNPMGNGFLDVAGQWEWLTGHVMENDQNMEIKSREGMLAEKKKIYAGIRDVPTEKAESVKTREVGRLGESQEQLRARILGHNSEIKEAADQKRLQQQMATDIRELKTGTLKVEVTKMPKEGAPSDSPTAPGPAV